MTDTDHIVQLTEDLERERAEHERTKAELGADLREAREAATRNATDCQHLRQSAIALTTERDAAKANELATLQRNADTKLLLGRAVASLQEAAARCSICRGAGRFWPHCDRCSDSTDDHECPLSKPCEQCAPWRAILADTTSAAAGEYVAALEVVYEAVKTYRTMHKLTLSEARRWDNSETGRILDDAIAVVTARGGTPELPSYAFRIIRSNAANAVDALVIIEANETVFEGVGGSENCAMCHEHVSRHYGGREYRCRQRSPEQGVLVAAEAKRRAAVDARKVRP